MADWKPNIFGYLDYRAYLRDYYEAAKAETRAFSYRYFSRKAGYSSPNFLKLVIDGQRNLSANSIDRFARALKLTATEKRFFADLVAFDQAADHEERNTAFEKISASRTFRSARRIDAAFFDYLSHWYYPAIRELAARPDFRAEPEWVARQLLPSIKTDEARRALDLLFEFGLLTREDDGTIGRADVGLTTGHEVRSLAVANFHRQMLARAADSIELVSGDRRDVSAITACISRDTVAELKRRVHDFREQVMDLCAREEAREAVYQLNIQLFPLSRIDHD